MEYRQIRSRSGGAVPWFLQRITGIVLLFVMIGHYLLMHYNVDSGHSYEAVYERMQNPFYKGMQMMFLTLGLYHGLNGTWSVIRDFKMKPWVSWTIYSVIVISSVIFLFIGINTLIAF